RGDRPAGAPAVVRSLVPPHRRPAAGDRSPTARIRAPVRSAGAALARRDRADGGQSIHRARVRAQHGDPARRPRVEPPLPPDHPGRLVPSTRPPRGRGPVPAPAAPLPTPPPATGGLRTSQGAREFLERGRTGADSDPSRMLGVGE